MIGRRGSTSGATGRAAVADRPLSPRRRRRQRATGSISGSPARRSSWRSRSDRLVASVAVQDIGTGSRTVSPIPSHANSASIRRRSRCGSAIRDLPEGPGSGGSRTTASIVPPLLVAAQKLKAAIERSAKSAPPPGSNAPWRELHRGVARYRASAKTRAEGRQAHGAGHPLAADARRASWAWCSAG